VQTCGNGVADPNEQCDGSDLGGFTCSDLGFDGGTLVCTSYCEFDSFTCTGGSCEEDLYHPNESHQDAVFIEVDAGFEADGLILCGDRDSDWFQFQLASNAMYLIEIGFDAGHGDADLDLYRESDPFEPVASSHGSSDIEQLEYISNGGSFFLQVSRYWSVFYQLAYRLAITRLGPPPRGDLCTNPFVVDAMPYREEQIDVSTFHDTLRFDGYSCTGFTTAGRDVFYQLSVTSGRSITVEVASDFDAAVFIVGDCPDSSAPDTACLAGVDAVWGDETEILQYTTESSGLIHVVVDDLYNSPDPENTLFDLNIYSN
jgi:hypothetical protein